MDFNAKSTAQGHLRTQKEKEVEEGGRRKRGTNKDNNEKKMGGEEEEWLEEGVRGEVRVREGGEKV